LPNFLQELKKMEISFRRISKWRQFSKWVEIWFFDHNSVSFELYCVLFFVLGLYFDRTYYIFHRRIFLADSRWRLMSKMGVENRGSISWIWEHFCIDFCNESVTSNMIRTHNLSKEPKIVHQSKITDQNQIC
jgi:hypothetical protein